MQLDALVTMLACLTSTQSDFGRKNLQANSLISDNCYLSILSNLTTRIQLISVEITNTKDHIQTLHEQLVDLRRGDLNRVTNTQTPSTLGLRFLDEDTQFLRAAAAQAEVRRNGPEMAIEPITPIDCLNQEHGVVRVRPLTNSEPFFVFCDQQTRGGGWIVVANRYDGSEDFYRKWTDYKIGFGSLTTEFFIGLEKLHQISSIRDYELLVLLENRKQELRYALYDQFSIGPESEQYRLNVLGEYMGDATDALRQHIGKKFSTHDKENVENKSNCAVEQSAAFWYNSDCTQSNPFGLYQRLLQRDVDGFKGILWSGFLDGPKGSLKLMRLLMRPRIKN